MSSNPNTRATIYKLQSESHASKLLWQNSKLRANFDSYPFTSLFLLGFRVFRNEHSLKVHLKKKKKRKNFKWWISFSSMSVVDEYTNDSKFTNNRVSAMNRSCYDFGFQIISYEHHGVSAIETSSFLFI